MKLANDKNKDPAELILDRFDKIYKKYAYTHPINYDMIAWGSFFTTYEDILRDGNHEIVIA